jgi:predicted small lipoprotein YifL
VISSNKSSPRNALLRPRAGAIALVILFALSASGCGRRGPLEAPPDPAATAAKPDDPNHPQVRHKATAITPPKDPFILDPLL